MRSGIRWIIYALTNDTRYKTSVAFFQAEHIASSVSAGAKSNAALTPCWRHWEKVEFLHL